MTIVPAYGRDYKSAAAAKADWEAGKDFRIADISSPYDGKYCSKRDGLTNITIRYDKLQKIVCLP
jgi:hypothetical protein